MTARLAQITRHPIKSVGYEDIGSALLTQGRALPLDRVWAISHVAAKFDGPLQAWARKMNFVRGVAAPGLMAVQAKTRDDGTITLIHPDLPELSIDPDRPEDQARLITWLAPLWPDTRPAPRAVERVAGVSLSDMAEPFVSILSLSSLAALGPDVSRHRFRANLAIAGWRPWAERDLIGQRLQIGPAVLRVDMPITRCRATCANPETGAEDIEMLERLTAQNGDTLFGIYATVVTGGTIMSNDAVEIPG